MRVLVACEESQTVCKQFRLNGHEAFSCDIQDCSGGFPEWHIKGSCLDVLDDGWDLLIAHPPCTYLTKAGACNIPSDPSRIKKGYEAKEFFMKLYNADIPHICIENPVPMARFDLPHWTQTVNPCDFGDPWTKLTCLWLKNLPPLIPTSFVDNSKSWCSYHRSAKIRSKTFRGIAEAMANQWDNAINFLEDCYV